MTKTSMVSDWETLTGAGKVVGQEFFRGTAGEPKNGILYAIDRRVDTVSREINKFQVEHGDIVLSGVSHEIFENNVADHKVIVLGVKFTLEIAGTALANLNQSNIKFVLDGGSISSPIDITAGIGIQLNDLIWQKATTADLLTTGGGTDDFLSVYIPLHVTLEYGESITVSTFNGTDDLFGSVDASYEVTVIG